MRQPPRCRVGIAIVAVVCGVGAMMLGARPAAATGASPIARITATPASNVAPTTVTFDASASYDPDGRIVAYKFDFDNGTANLRTTSPIASSTYPLSGGYKVTVKVTDDSGLTAVATVGMKLAATSSPTTTTKSPTTTTTTKPPTTTSTTAPPTTTTTKPAPTTTTAPPVVAPGAQVPADVLNLANWKLTLPVGTQQAGKPDEIYQPQLARFSLSPYFMLDPAKTAVVFAAPVGGVTTSNSGYPRSELREMKGSSEASWSNVTGVHTMTVTEAITHLPVVKPHVVAAQIHDAQDDVLMVRLERSNLFVEHNGTNLGTLDANYQLGTVYTVKLVAAEDHIKIFYNGVLKVDTARSGSGWYFKAGCYTQSNPTKGDAPDAYGEVVIQSLTVTHA
jgi:hypothetical protein